MEEKRDFGARTPRHFLFGLAMQQTVLVLHAHESRGSGPRVARFACVPELRCRKIGASNFKHLAGLHERVERPQRLRNRNVRIRYVLLIEINAARSESLE